MRSAPRENAGLRNHLFTLLEPSETGGDATVTYTPRGTAWGSLVANASTAFGLMAQTSFTIETLAQPNLTVKPTWQLAEGARRFALTGVPVDPDGRNRDWRLQATEVVSP